MIENHMIDRSDGPLHARVALQTSTLEVRKTRAWNTARAQARTYAPAPARARGPVTIPGDPASGTRRGKIGRSPRRSPYDLPISIFLFSETVATPKFFEV
jgi:hypothetical protein